MSDLNREFLGKYLLLMQIGQGGMADVYKAYDPDLKRHVAVKVLRILLEGQKDFIARFKREAVAVASLHHQHIVQVYDFGTSDSLYYLVMEFVDGPTLENELKRRLDNNQTFTLAEINNIFSQLSDAVSHAHRQGTIHRDLKPSNIMFRNHGEIVLTDFGLARLMNGPTHTESGMMIGTLKYMSPEQCQGRSSDHRSDIYSLGIVLYEMMTGKTPFIAEQPFGLINKHIYEQPASPTQFNPHLPKNVEQVILKSLNKNPQDRYQTVAEMAHALQIAIKEWEAVNNSPQKWQIPDTFVPIKNQDSPYSSDQPVLSSTPLLSVKATGISNKSLHDLRNVLLECGPFASTQGLNAVFVDSRLSPWKGQLPEANNPIDRVDNSIDFLHKHYNDAGENALVLFLRVLQERISQQEMCWEKLGKSADQLEQELGSSFVPENKVSIVVYDRPGIFEKPAQLFGREALLDEIRPLLNKKQHLLLHGLGGCGKTALAATLADTLLHQGNQSVIWIQAENADADAIFDALVDQLADSPREKQDIRKALGNNKLKKVRDLLRRYQPSLLVVDNVWNENALKMLRGLDNMAVIVTSRRRLTWPQPFHIKDVDDLLPDAALSLLSYCAGDQNLQHDPDAPKLCKLLGYHAYAVEIAGNILKVDNRTPLQLLTHIDDAPHRITMPEGDIESGRESVGALLETSFNFLGKLERTALLAFGDLFSSGATFELLSLFIPRIETNLNQALNTLVRHGLVKRRPYRDSELEYYYMHDLTFHYVKGKARQAKGGDDVTRVKTVLQYLIKYLQDFDRLELDMANILGAAKAATETIPEYLVQIMSWLCVGGYPEPQGIPSYLDKHGHSLPLLRRLDRAIAVAGQMGLNEVQHYLWGKRGNAYHDRGEKENCLGAYKKAMAIAPNSYRHIILLAEIGKVSGELALETNEPGKVEEATTILQEANKLAQDARDDNALMKVLEVQSFWAARQKDFEATRQFAAQSVDLAKRQGNKKILGFALLNLGSAERDLGDADKALSTHKRTLVIAKEEDLQALEAYSWQAMGEDYYHLHQLDKVIDCFNKAIAIHVQTGGTDNITYIQKFCEEKGITLKED